MWHLHLPAGFSKKRPGTSLTDWVFSDSGCLFHARQPSSSPLEQLTRGERAAVKGAVTPQPSRKKGLAGALHPLAARRDPAGTGTSLCPCPAAAPGVGLAPQNPWVSPPAETLPLAIFFLSLLLLSRSKAEICSQDRAGRQNNSVGFSKAAASVERAELSPLPLSLKR